MADFNFNGYFKRVASVIRIYYGLMFLFFFSSAQVLSAPHLKTKISLDAAIGAAMNRLNEFKNKIDGSNSSSRCLKVYPPSEGKKSAYNPFLVEAGVSPGGYVNQELSYVNQYLYQLGEFLEPSKKKKTEGVDRSAYWNSIKAQQMSSSSKGATVCGFVDKQKLEAMLDILKDVKGPCDAKAYLLDLKNLLDQKKILDVSELEQMAKVLGGLGEYLNEIRGREIEVETNVKATALSELHLAKLKMLETEVEKLRKHMVIPVDLMFNKPDIVAENWRSIEVKVSKSPEEISSWKHPPYKMTPNAAEYNWPEAVVGTWKKGESYTLADAQRDFSGAKEIKIGEDVKSSVLEKGDTDKLDSKGANLDRGFCEIGRLESFMTKSYTGSELPEALLKSIPSYELSSTIAEAPASETQTDSAEEGFAHDLMNLVK